VSNGDPRRAEPWRPELVLCNVAVAGVPFIEHVAAAQAAGFDAISLLGRAHRRATQRDGLSEHDMITILDDYGIVLTDVEAVGDWLGPAPADQPKFLDHVYPAKTYLDIAAALGARTVVAVHFGAPAPIDLAVTRFIDLCDAAAGCDLDIALEFPSFATISDVSAAWDIVRLADRPNGGLLIDTWHHRRSLVGDDALRAIDGTKVFSVQLSDGPSDPVGPALSDVTHRSMPGAGAFGVADLVRLLDGLGTRAPIGIEVFDQALLERSAQRAAQELGDALREVLSEALL
jgi:sugar phosphate isomerase/epimerase